MEGESGVNQRIFAEFHSSDIERDQMEGSSGYTGSINDEPHSLDIQGDQKKR